MNHIFSSLLSPTPSERTAWGHGLQTTAHDGTILDTWFPNPKLGRFNAHTDSAGAASFEDQSSTDPRRHVHVDAITVEIDLNEPPASTPDAYLRLHLLSTIQVKPNTINLNGLFEHLPLVVWTSAGPMLPSEVERLRPNLRHAGIHIVGYDKFPRMLDYVVPDRVRIADAARVRLGAYLAPGTTIMHEGFVNFNAGTLGATMVEGRISQGVVVGVGSDIGGGASIMGTLSGGGKMRISIGERSLIGANAGIGISIGNDTIVEAGLYVTAGTKVVVLDQEFAQELGAHTVKASLLSGMSNLLFRRNSLTGAVEVLQRKTASVHLNSSLHA